MRNIEKQISAVIDPKVFTNFRIKVAVRKTNTTAVIRKCLKLYNKDNTFAATVDKEKE